MTTHDLEAFRRHILAADQESAKMIKALCDEIETLRAHRGRMRRAIERALSDEESGTGWGPDVTVCAYLRASLENPNS